jgi:predicted cation transporter
MVIAGLLVILLLVLTLPFFIKKVERNLGVFLFVMGIIACIITGKLTVPLSLKALREPWGIALAVLLAGSLFFILKDQFSAFMNRVFEKVPVPLLVFIVILVLGLLSSVITAIIASLVLVEIICQLPLERKHRINICIISCFSIGIGAVMTPIGEPLATITVSKLNESFFYLFHLLGPYVIPSIVAFALIGAVYCMVVYSMANKRNKEFSEAAITSESADEGLNNINEEGWPDIILRTFKVYLFIMALVFLGEGFEPLIQKYVIHLSPQLLYWINMVSAVIDNATITSAEISPLMDEAHIEAILMGLLISGGMLIPGNIPNIIAASKLKITSTEWAKIGIPLGLMVMAIFYVILFIFVGIGA